MVEDPGADRGVVARQRAGDVLGRLADVDADLLAPHGRRDGRRAARPPSRWRCGSGRSASRRAAPRPCRRGPAAGRGSRRGVDDLGQLRRRSGRRCRAGGGSRAEHRGRRCATASSISASETSSGGAKRSAVGVTALTTSPRSSSAAWTPLAAPCGLEDGGLELGRRAAARGRAWRRTPGMASSGRAAGRPPSAARTGTSSASITPSVASAADAGERLAAEGAAVVPGLERGGHVGPRPARADRHRRCRGPWRW